MAELRKQRAAAPKRNRRSKKQQSAAVRAPGSNEAGQLDFKVDEALAREPQKQAAKKEIVSPHAQDITASPNVVSAGTYAFTGSTGAALEDMSSGTTVLLTADLDDTASAVTPIGFDFWFDGVRQTLFSVNANGLMRLGVTPVSTAFTNDLASATNVPQIAPYWDDQWIGNNGKVHYKVVGSAPNRKLVVEWQNEQIPRVATATAGAGTFQAWLYESTGKIEFVYGSGVAVNSANSGYSVGFGSSATQFVSVTTSGPTAAYGTANNTQTGAITSGTKYTFTPNIPADPDALTYTAVGLNTMTLNWADNATNEVGYAVYRSLDGTNYEFVAQTAANATSYIATGLASNTTYFWKVYAVTEGGLSVNAATSPSQISSQATTTGTLVGTKSVGPTGDYATIGAAIADINSNGLAGSLILELQSTYLGTAETFPLVVNACGSPSNTITIRPESGAAGLSITSATTSATLDLNGGTAPFGPTNVIIDGRAGGTGPSQLTIGNTATAGVAVRFINGASRNTIKFCTIQGVNTSTTGGVVLFSTSGAVAASNVTGNNNNTIDSCDVKDGATTPVNGITSIGTATTPLLNTGNVISNNNISNFFNAGSVTRGILVTTNTDLSNTAWTISNNRLFQTASRTYTTGNAHIGIFVNGGNDYSITGNVVGFANSSGTGTYSMTGTNATGFSGIVVQPGDGQNSVQGNTVAGISLGTTTGTLQGISVATGSANIGTISGNTVGSGTGNGSLTATSTTSGAFIVGLNVSGTAAGTINVSNNTIGSLTATGSPATINPNMNVVQILGGLVTFTNNLLGSNSTANSIQTTTAGTSATAQQLIGMLCGTTSPLTISNNTVANVTNAGTGTAHVLRGIQLQSPGVSSTASAGTGTISLNIVHDLTGSNANTAAGATNGIFVTTGTGGAPNGCLIEQNSVYSIKATNVGAVATVPIGIVLSGASSTVGVTGGVVSKNKVYDIRNASTGTTATTPPIASGILVQTATTFAQVANNMISLGIGQATNTEFIGLWSNFTSVATLRAYYNSVHIEGAAAAGALPSYCFLRGSNAAASAITTPVDIKNNILDNTRTGGTGKHYAIGNVNTTPVTGWSNTASNNNVLNSAVAGTVGIWGLTTDETFTNWKSASGADGASLSGVAVTNVDAPNGDLHVNFGVTPTAIESGGTAIAGLTVDYDMQTRPGPAGSVNGGATAPDIGADEFDGVPLDISAPGIGYTSLGNTPGTSNRTLSATITDATAVDSGANLPRIYFKKSTDASYVSTQCVMTGGTTQNGTYDCTVDYSLVGGGSVMANDMIQYFVVAQDTIGNLGSNPGGATGANVNSVTFGGVPNVYTILPTISGSKTVGAGGDYADITAAVSALNNSVLTGPVTFLLTDPSYTSAPSVPNTLPVTINANSGSSAVNTVTFRPASAQTVSISGSSATALMTLNGADWVTIDGSNNGTSSRDLTIANTNTGTSSAVIWLQNAGADGATNNVIKNVNLVGNSNTTTLFGVGSGSSTISITSAGAGNNNNTFQNCNITKTQYGIYSGGASAANKNTGNVISGNLMNSASPNNIGKGGILVGFENGIQIVANSISGISNGVSSFDAFGISLGFSGDQVSPTGFTGSEVTNAVVTSNYIGSVAHTATYSATGIAIASAASGTTLIDNNFIAGVTANSTAGDLAAGIFVGGGAGSTTDIYANSISMTGNRGSGTTLPSYALAIGGSNPTVDVRDNILLNTQTTASTGKSYAIGTASTTFTNLTSNYNDLFVSGTNTFVGQTGGLGTTGTDRSNLAAWIAATGKDTPNSLSADPLFISTTDVHLSSNTSPAANAGTPLGGITTDFDGDPRSAAHPDMGADEVASNKLANLVPGMGSLTPAFDPDVISYTESVANEISTITFTPTALDSNAAITVNGNAVTSGMASDPISLDVGDNTITVVVTPEFGPFLADQPETGTAQTYTVVVTRALAVYTLTYTAGMHGSISGTTPQMVQQGNDGAPVTAVPDTGYHFVNWSDNSTENPRTDTNVMADVNVTAAFAINTYTLTYNSAGNGSISGTSPQTVNYGDDGSAVTAVPNTGYHFVNWSDNSTENPRTDTNVMTDVNVTANFAINSYTLTYSSGGNGSISGPSSQMVNYGENGSAVTAVPDTGYHFVNWSDSSTENPRTDMNVMANINVTATFAINTYTLTYTAGANGSITGTSPQTVNYGENGSAVTAVPDTGYHFVNWSDSSTENPRTDMNVMANINVTATFASDGGTNANLSNLVLSAGTLNPPFDPATFNYTASVAFITSSMTVTPTVEDANATITVNGQPVGSGMQSQSIDLNVGSNTITTVVTASDNMTTQTYTVNVSRGAQVEVTASGGTSNATYTTVKGAFDAINTGTHTGTITISILGDTTEVASAALNASGTGSASYTSIAMSPSGGAARAVSGAILAGNPLIDLNGAANVTIDGLNSGGNALTLSNTTVSSTASTSTIRFISGASNNLVTRCTVSGSSTSAVGAAGGNIFFSTSTVAGGNSNNTVSYCNLGPAGSNLPTKVVMGLGTSANPNSGNIIDNNSIFDFFSATTSVSGISVSSNCNNWTISNNRIYQTAARTFTSTALRYAGITLSSSGNSFAITGNVIGFGAANGTGTTTISGSTNEFRGIDAPTVGTTTATSIQGNTVSGITQTTARNSTSSTSTAFVGIMLGTSAGRFDVGTTTGNTIGSLDGSSTIVINGTSTTTSTSPAVGIFDFSVSSNTISNNNIGALTIQSTGTVLGFRGVFVNTGSSATTTISNNTIGGAVAGGAITDTQIGSYAIYGIQSALPSATITGNVIQNMSGNSTGASLIVSSGMVLTGSTGVNTISQNVVHSLSNNSGAASNSVYAIYCSLPSTANVIERNLVHSLSMTSTISTGQLVGILPVAGSGTYRNNMVRLGLDATGASITNGLAVYGMFEIAGTNNIYNNSVYVGGTGVSSSSNTFAFVSNVASGTRNYLDNVFWNARSNASGTGKNYAIAVGGSVVNPPGLTSDYNDLYATGMGGVLGLFNTADQTSLANWRTATGQDNNSLSGDPQFIAPNGTAVTGDLHIHPANPTPIESAGLALGAVTDDFDGQTRASLTPTDIGADAGNFVGQDLSSPTISYTQFGNTISTMNRTLSATISDATAVDSGANTPRIYFKKSTDPSYVSTQCSMTGGTTQNGTYDCTIDYSLVGGGSVTVNDVVQYFVVAQDTLGNLGSVPGGATGGDVNNITFSGLPNSYSILATLMGTKTVGAGGDYPDLGSAVSVLNNSVLTGPVTFLLTDPSYTGAPSVIDTLPVAINPNTGSSATNTVTIKPSSGQTVTVTGSSAAALITLNGADYVTIDGSNNGTSSRDLTIANTNSGTSSAVVWLQNAGGDGATHNTIKNVNLVGNSNTTTLVGLGSGGSAIGISSTGSGNNSNTFQNCSVSKTQYAIYSGGASAANKNNGNVITQNLINTTSPDNVAKGAILVKFEDGVQISYNTISGINFTTNFSPSVFGIALGVTPSNTYTSFTGSDVTNAMVVGNVIGSVVQAGTGSAFGIVVNSVTSGTTLVANNMVSGVSANTTPSDFTCGILAGGGTGSTTQVYFNSVSMTGSRGAATSPSYALAINAGNPIVDVRDNILLNAQTSTNSGKNYAMANGSTTFSNMTSNNNDLFVAGSSSFVGQTGGIGTSGADRAALSDWQNATGGDANSISADPLFASTSDLHLSTNASPVANIGQPVVGMTIDIDGDARSAAHPDIGADEIVSADLSNLTISTGTLVPAFDPAITSYTVSVPHGTTSMTVTPTVVDSNADVSVNANAVPSGTESDPIDLDVGDNTIDVMVTSEFGSPTKLYSIVVNRAPLPPVTNFGDAGPGSLRQALADALDGDTITFGVGPIAPNAPAVATVITLTSGELAVNANVTVTGPGADMLEVTRDNMAGPFRIFHVTPNHTVTIEGMTVSNGSAQGSFPDNVGGGVYSDHATLTVNGCFITGNSAVNGGGIYSAGGISGASLTVTNSTLAGNLAQSGGGIYNEGEGGVNAPNPAIMAAVTLNNTTVSGNAVSVRGGGIYNDGENSGHAQLTISNTTFSDNTAPASSGSGIYNDGAVGSATLDIGNTILNAGVGAAGGMLVNANGTVISHGYNLSSDNGGGFLAAIGDQINTDPMLGPLKSNGGATLTHAPLINSPAIDQGKRDAIPALTTNVDQRGFTRPIDDPAVANAVGGDASDIGAVEDAAGVHPTTAVSRKTHGGADFDVNLPFAGMAAVECRSSGANGDYQIIVTFAQPVSVTSAGITSGSGIVSGISITSADSPDGIPVGTQVTIDLTSVTNVQTLTLALFGTTDGTNSGDVGVRMSVIIGDVTGDGHVGVSDIAQVKAQSGQAAGAGNFRNDVNVSGAITSADISLVKSQSGSGLQ